MSVNKAVTEAKRAYAMKLVAAAEAKGIISPVIVLPEVEEDGGEIMVSNTCAIPSPNSTKGWGYVQLFQVRNIRDKQAVYQRESWAIVRSKMAYLTSVHHAGQILSGNIVTEDSMTPPNPANPAQDLKYGSEALRTAGLPMKVGDQPIYSVRYWDDTGLVKDTTIVHTNQAELEAFTAADKAASNKPNSEGIKSASAALMAGK